MLDANDLDLLSSEVRRGSNDRLYDLNGDESVDAMDRSVWVHDLKGTYFGDANLDGQFNSADLVAVFTAGEYEDDVAGNSGWASGDWNGDHDFGSEDLVVAFQEGAYERAPRPPVAAVPEPSGMLLFGLALIGISMDPRTSSSMNHTSFHSNS